MNLQKSTVVINNPNDKEWFVIDATDMIVGRLAAQISQILMGKHKPTYTPFSDTGDFVVIINAEKIRLTGNKSGQKSYIHHSLYPGGLKEVSFERMRKEHPDRIMQKAIARMMPKTKLGDAMMTKLYVYAGESHPHGAQNPKSLNMDKCRRVV